MPQYLSVDWESPKQDYQTAKVISKMIKAIQGGTGTHTLLQRQRDRSKDERWFWVYFICKNVEGSLTWELRAFMSLGAAPTGLAAFPFRGSSPPPWQGSSWGNNHCRGGLAQFHVQGLNLLLLAALQLLDLFKVPSKLQNSEIYENSVCAHTCKQLLPSSRAWAASLVKLSNI